VQVLHVEDPENVWVRRLQDKSYFFQLDEEIQEYCRYTKILVYSAGILDLSMMARNRVGIGLLYRGDRLHRLAESIPWNQCLYSILEREYWHYKLC
jgi:hypothetical protein